MDNQQDEEGYYYHDPRCSNWTIFCGIVKFIPLAIMYLLQAGMFLFQMYASLWLFVMFFKYLPVIIFISIFCPSFLIATTSAAFSMWGSALR